MEKGSSTLDAFLSKSRDPLSDTSKYSSVPLNVNESGSLEGNTLQSRGNKSDELFKNLIERCNRSREFIENVHRSTFDSNYSDSQPTKEKSQPQLSSRKMSIGKAEHTPVTYGSGSYEQPQSVRETETRPLQRGLNYTMETSASRTGLRGDVSADAYHSNDLTRLENEIQELKNATLDKLRSDRSQPAAKSILAKNRKYELISSDEDQDEQILTSKETASNRATVKPVSKNTSAKVMKKTRSPTREDPSINTSLSKPKLKTLRPDTAKSVSKLKSTIEERENTLQDKYMNLKCKAREMRTTLQEYVTKCLDLEDTVNQKNKRLTECEGQLKGGQQELMKQLELLQEIAKREDRWLKTEHELLAQNEQLKRTEEGQRKRLEEIENFVQTNEEKYYSHLEGLQKEKQEAWTNIRLRDERITEQSKVIETLKSELEVFRRDTQTLEARKGDLESTHQSKNQEIRNLKDQLEDSERLARELKSKVDELKENKVYLEDKVAKHKKRLEDERAKLQEEKTKETDSKKEKIKKLKDELKQLEGITQQLAEEKKASALEVEKQISQKMTAERELFRLKEEVNALKHEDSSLRATNESLKEQNEEIFRSYQKECDKASELQLELKKTSRQLKKAAEQIELREKDSVKVEELIARLQQEMKLLLEDNAKGRDYIVQLESTLTFMKTRQEDEMVKVENKIGELDQEMKLVKDENTLLKSTESQVYKELEIVKDERDRFRKDYKTVKQVNKTLERDLKAIDQKVKDFMAEKESVLQEQHLRDSAVKSINNTKLKTLGDIHSLIDGFRRGKSEGFEPIKDS